MQLILDFVLISNLCFCGTFIVIKKFFTLDIYKVASVFARHGGCPGGVTNSENTGKGGEGGLNIHNLAGHPL
jgi:hypothetical protein